MKKRHIITIRLVLLTVILIGIKVNAATLNGVITDDTLKVANSPFIVTGNISVPSGQTLTINSGVILKFNDGLNFTINGTLNAAGTAADSIRFTSNNSSPNTGDWNGIIFSNSSAGSIKYAIVEFASQGITSSTSSPTISHSNLKFNNNGIDCLNSSTALIESNKFQNNGNTAIRSNNSTPTISKNDILNNIAVSSAILCTASSPWISENIIRDNNNTAIECGNGSNPKIWQNTVVLNSFGVLIDEASSPIIKNNIIGHNSNLGLAINDAFSSPSIMYNDFWSNSGGDLYGTPPEVGSLTTTNANGDPSDIFYNIFLDPVFVDLNNRDFQIQATSPCIDAGDPSNPAGINMWGSAPDQGKYEYGTTVPVELVNFKFVSGLLKWTTASETNNFGFEIQRCRSENDQFVQIGFVPGAGTTVIPQYYEFQDTVQKGSYYYRLKQIDTDGSFEFSKIIKAVYSNPTSFVLFQNYPNPFNPSTTITFQVPDNFSSTQIDNMTMTIYNSLGQEVIVLFNDRKRPGSYQLQWNGVDKLGKPVSSGIYFYQLKAGEKVQTRRMLLSR